MTQIQFHFLFLLCFLWAIICLFGRACVWYILYEEKTTGGLEYAKEKVSEGVQSLEETAQKGTDYLKQKTGETIETIDEKTKEFAEKAKEKGEALKQNNQQEKQQQQREEDDDDDDKKSTLFEKVKEKLGFR